jgi:hypothetical protein
LKTSIKKSPKIWIKWGEHENNAFKNQQLANKIGLALPH